MNFNSALVVLAATAFVPLSIAFTARFLVPAGVAASGYWVTSAFIAMAIVPFLIALESGASWWLWCFGLMGAAPYAAALYLRGRARSVAGSPLGFRAASELSMWAVCVALTAGIALWGWAHAE